MKRNLECNCDSEKKKIPEPNLDIDEKLYACFKDWQKAFERVNGTKLIQITKGNDIE
jgi:hypothetical protein